MVVAGRRKSIAFFIALGAGLISVTLLLYIGWVLLNWRAGILLFFASLLLAMIIALHPTGLTLLAVTVAALLIAPRWPTRRDALVGVGLVVLLLLPTILWELLSGFSDVALLGQFSGQPSVINGDVFLAFNHLLGCSASRAVSSGESVKVACASRA